MIIEGLEHIEGPAPVIGWLIWKDGLEPLWDTDGPLVFTDYTEALAKRGLLDTCEPATAADVERARVLYGQYRARRRFGAKNKNGRR